MSNDNFQSVEDDSKPTSSQLTLNNQIDKYNLAKNILRKYNQEHLLCLYDELSENEKEILLNQILAINFEEILTLYKNSITNKFVLTQKVSPLEHFEKNRLSDEEIKHFSRLGETEIKNNSFAVVTMAGGQGTRLGYSGPKGTYMLDLRPKRKSLFEIMCEDIKRTNEKYNVVIPWYIMTSDENDAATKNFFESNDFFGYPSKKITFFKQDKLPIVNIEGKLILQEPYLIKEASNGNGNVFKALLKNNIIEQMESNGIKWISFGGIDNVLLKNVDPLLLGMTIEKHLLIASKTIFKKGALEKTAVYCRKDGKPAILDYDDINLELSEETDSNGLFLYREANMLSHLMSLDAVKKVSTKTLPYHRAYKKNAFVNFEGVKQVPDKPNTFKFEKFIFDAFSFFDDMLLLRVNPNEEFAPIKDFTGIYNPDTAKEKYEKFWKL